MSAVAPGNPLQPKPYFACRGRGFGKAGGEEAVTVVSQEAPVAVVPNQNKNETASAPALPARDFTESFDGSVRLQFGNACAIQDDKMRAEKNTR